jgi:Zn-dependent protease with chaperone function
LTEEQFGRLVRRIEKSAQRGYSTYLRRAWLLGWVGVALPVALAVACLAFTALALAVAPASTRLALNIVLMLASVPLFMVVRTFFVTLPPPQGVRLEPEAFPELFGLFERLGAGVRAPLPDAVYLDGSFNAAVTQSREGGVFGTRRIALTLGLPLLDCLSPSQFEAVLAHEFGHIGNGSGATSTQIYAMRLMMEKLAGHAGGDPNLVVRVVGPFYRRFVRYFDAYSCVAARRVETDADSAAAEQVGSLTFAAALVAVSVQDRRLDRDFWEPLATELQVCPVPPLDVYDRIAEVAALPLADAGPLLRGALSVASRSGDTHPSLSERLSALDVLPEDALAPLQSGALRETGSAAVAYLGAERPVIASELGERWAAEHAHVWETARSEREARTARLAELETRALPLTREEAHERMQLAYAVERPDVEKLARELLARDACDTVAHYYLGTTLADRDDPGALAWLESAFDAGEEAVIQAANRAIALLVKLGRVEEAERFADRAVARLEELDADRERRSTCSADEVFVPHGLEAEVVRRLSDILARHESIEAAFLVRRTLAGPNPAPAFALVIERQRRKKEVADERFTAQLCDELSAFGDFFVTTAAGRGGLLRRSCARISGAAIFEAA